MVGTSTNKSIAQLFEMIDAKDLLRKEIADGPDICFNYARTAMPEYTNARTESIEWLRALIPKSIKKKRESDVGLKSYIQPSSI